MRSLWRACLAIISICGAVCYSQTQSDDEQSIRTLLDHQCAAWNRGDIAGYMEGYWKSDSLLFTSGGTIRRGWDETLQKYRQKYDSREKMGKLAFSDVSVKLLSDRSAWVFGRWKIDRTGDAPDGVFTLILKRLSNGWKIIHDHSSLSPPIPAGK